MLVALRDAGLSLASVAVHKPSLDEVFLALTGHDTGRVADDEDAGTDNHPNDDLTVEVTR